MICEEIEDTNDCTYDKDYVPEWFTSAVQYLIQLSGWEVQYKEFAYYKEFVSKGWQYPWVKVENMKANMLFRTPYIEIYVNIELTCKKGVPKIVLVDITTPTSLHEFEMPTDYFVNYLNHNI